MIGGILFDAIRVDTPAAARAECAREGQDISHGRRLIMNRLILSCLFGLSLCGCESMHRSSASPGASADDNAPQHMYAPNQIKWEPGPPSLLPGAEMAVLEGDPGKPGFFAMRLRFPDGYRVMPHWHPKQERVTILSGTLNLGMGDTYDASKTHALTAGSYSTMPAGMRHFANAKGVTELQLATNGPWGIHYVNRADDPRKAGK
jgi:quercetin dioxygenase-like cupin family protein